MNKKGIRRFFIYVVVSALIVSNFTMFSFANEAAQRDLSSNTGQSQSAELKDAQKSADVQDQNVQNGTDLDTGSDDAAPGNNDSGIDGKEEQTDKNAQSEKNSDKRNSYSAKRVKTSAAPKSENSEEHFITYRFFVSGESQPVSEQIVGEGDRLYRPATPSDKSGSKFTGWFEKNSDEPFKDFGIVGKVEEEKTVDLYACFDSDVLVSYYDEDGAVISRKNYKSGSEIEISPRYPMISVNKLTNEHVGWTFTKGSRNEVSGKYTLGNKDVDLYPIVLNGYRVSFNTTGGTYVRDQFLEHSSVNSVLKATRPADPEREGYIFTGWYEDRAATEAFDFDKPVSEPKTIYAGWSASDETSYTVKYWAECPTADNEGFEYRLVAVERQRGTTGENTQFDEELLFGERFDLPKPGYSLNVAKSPSMEIKADGTSEMNVYYDRNVFTFTFTAMKDKDGNPYSVTKTAKYGTSIMDLWKEMDERSGLDDLFAKGHFKWGTMHLDNPYDITSIFYHDTVFSYGPRQQTSKHARFFYETLEGVAPEGKAVYSNTSARVLSGTVTDDRTYYIDEYFSFAAAMKACIVFDDEKKGFTLVQTISDGNYAWATVGGVSLPGIWYYGIGNVLRGVDNTKLGEGGMAYYYSPGGIPENPEANVYYDADGYMDVYYVRNKYKLSFETNGGPEVKEAEVYYEKNLSTYMPENYVAGVTEKVIADGHTMVFEGWYADPALTVPFYFTGGMPANDMVVYAKWNSVKYSAVFDSNGGSEVKAQNGIEYGGQVYKPEDPFWEGKTFLGWVMGKTPYVFSEKVFENITLVAMWKDNEKYSVKYDLNGGKGTAPADNAKYGRNVSARVMEIGEVEAPDNKCFIGWEDAETGEFYYPGDMVEIENGNILLKAVWDDLPTPTELIYDFNFEKFGITKEMIVKGGYSAKSESNGSRMIKVVMGLINNSLINLEDATALLGGSVEGYRFTGWHLKQDCSDEAISSLRVRLLRETGNIVYASWEKVEATEEVIIYPEDSEEVEPQIGTPAYEEPEEIISSDKKMKPNAALEIEKTDSKKNPESGRVAKHEAEKREGAYMSAATGDESTMTFWFVLCAGALIVIATVTMIGAVRRRNN